jgi:hypothetical protein
MLEEAKKIKIIEESKVRLIAHIPTPLAIGTENKRNNLNNLEWFSFLLYQQNFFLLIC